MPKILISFIALLCVVRLAAQPTFTSFPADVTLECSAPLPTQLPIATSACLPVNIAKSEFTTVSATCAQSKSVKRVYTATDNCGLVLTKTQIITILDTKAPSIVFTAPQLVGKKNLDTLVLDCSNPPVFDAGSAIAIDECDPIVKIKFQDNLVQVGDCPKDGFIMIMDCSWIAEDDCGNKTEIRLFFKVIDNKPPAITGVPKDLTISCDDLNNYLGFQPIIKDDCDGAPAISIDLKDTPSGICPGKHTITRTWKATDKCGNIATAKQVITVDDTTPPTISTKPKDVTIQYGQPFPPAPTLSAVDNCPQQITTKLKIIRQAIGCDSLITYQCTATDLCGNSAVLSQNVTIIMPKPTAGELKPDSTSYCIGANANVSVTLKESIKSSVPNNYSVMYFAIDAKNGDVLFTNPTPTFTFNQTGTYSFHTLVYNSLFDFSKVKNIADISKDKNCFAFNQTGISVPIKTCDIPNGSGCTPPNLNGAVVKNASCGKKDGSIRLNISNTNVTFSWSNGEKTDFIEKLNAGAYTVTVANSNDAKCFSVKTFVINDTGAPIVSTPTTLPTPCNKNIGEAVFADKSLTYTWFDGKKTSSRNDLSIGTYYVTVTKDSCSSVVSFSIFSFGALSTDITINKKADCKANNGAATINTSNGSGNYTYSWGTSNSQNNLSAGLYTVTVSDVDFGCTAVATFVMPNNSTDSATIALNIEKGKCPSDYAVLKPTINVSANFPTPFYTKILDAKGNIYQETQLPTGDFNFILYDANGCLIKSQAFSVKNPEPIVVVLDVTEKDCKGNVSVAVSGGTSPYNFDWSDTASTNDPKDRQDLPKGSYDLKVSDANSCSISSNIVISDKTCSNVPCKSFIIEKDITLNAKDCSKGENACISLNINTISNYNITDNGKIYAGQITGCDSAQAFIHTSMNFSEGSHIVIFEEKISGCKDTLNVTIVCDKCPTIYTGSLSVVADSCNGSAKICLNVTPSDLKNTTITNNGVVYTKPLVTCGNNNTQITLPIGKNTLNFKDSITLCEKSYTIDVTCKKDTTKNGVTYITKKICVPDSLDFCFDTTNVVQPYTITDICANKKTKAISYKINNLCINIKATAAGKDTLCMFLCDGKKKCDTLYLIVEVCNNINPNKIDTIYKEVCVGKSITACVGKVSTSEVSNVDNFCPTTSGYADFNITPKQNCIEIAGKKVGKTTACIRVCSTKGTCDTTILIVDVKDCGNGNLLPIAIKDTVSTFMDQAVLVKPMDNDTINGSLIDFGFISNPSHGQAVINTDKSLTYTPALSFCNGIDTFQYFIQNQNGKDTATICVTIECEKFVIYNGFSPNGDNANTHFHIKGIELYEDNIVTIYNRWGNIVFQRERYRNDSGWDGTFNGGELCPDGTYFYYVELPRVNRAYSGFLLLKR